jgi:multicomponent Na+:H+ antiporter subunit F
MSTDVSWLFAQTVDLVLGMLSIAMLLCFLRLVRGPSLPDRVVAFELMTAVVVGIIATYAIRSRQPLFLDAASVLALISFLGTVAFARYIEKAAFPWQNW